MEFLLIFRRNTSAPCVTTTAFLKTLATAILACTSEAFFLKRTVFDNATHPTCGPDSGYLFTQFEGCEDADPKAPQLPFSCIKFPSGGGSRPEPKRWSFLNVTETGDAKAPYVVKEGICYYDESKPDPERPCDADRKECQVFDTYVLKGASPVPGDPTSAGSYCDARPLYSTKYEVVAGNALKTLLKTPPPFTAVLVGCGASPVRDGPCGAHYLMVQVR